MPAIPVLRRWHAGKKIRSSRSSSVTESVLGNLGYMRPCL